MQRGIIVYTHSLRATNNEHTCTQHQHRNVIFSTGLMTQVCSNNDQIQNYHWTELCYSFFLFLYLYHICAYWQQLSI